MDDVPVGYIECRVLDCRAFDQQTYSSIRAMLNDVRRDLADTYVFFPDRVMSAVAGAAMYELADRFDTDIRILPDGKPVLMRDDVHMNVSHSGMVIAVVWSDRDIGVDVQEVVPMTGLENQVLSDGEKSRFCGHVDGDLFIDIWAVKESYIKMTGEGFSCPINTLDLTFDRSFVSPDPDYEFTVTHPIPGFSLAVCGALGRIPRTRNIRVNGPSSILSM